MALTDLLWACPDCRELGALRPAGKSARCASCDTVYRRGRGARIRAERRGTRPRIMSAAEWVDRLPPIDTVIDHDAPVWQEERVEVRSATGTEAVRCAGEYLGRMEHFGPARQGSIALEPRAVVLRYRTGSEHRRALEDLTAVQASSRTLQLKFHRQPVSSLRFPDGSVRFWELLLQHALRRYYRVTGRGEIREFQPRVVTR